VPGSDGAGTDPFIAAPVIAHLQGMPGEHDHVLLERRKERRVQPPAVTGE
jgi:hypothetical protein